MKAIILAGGKGTRLGEPYKNTPKCLVPIVGRPFIEYLLEFLKRQGVCDVLFCLGHLAEQVQSVLGLGEKYGIKITYSIEDKPLGTGGALIHAFDNLDEVNLVLNGDTFLNLNVCDMLNFHKEKKSEMTIGMIRADDSDGSYGRLIVDRNWRIQAFDKEEIKQESFISAGFCVLNKGIINKSLSLREPISLEDMLIPDWIQSKESAVYGYELPCRYFYDIGTPERISRFENYLKKGDEIC